MVNVCSYEVYQQINDDTFNSSLDFCTPNNLRNKKVLTFDMTQDTSEPVSVFVVGSLLHGMAMHGMVYGILKSHCHCM